MGSVTMKKRRFCGAICEQIVYQAPDGLADPKHWDPEKKARKERFKDAAAYAKFKTEIARRRHFRKFQANFHAGDLFSTLTFDDEWECTDFKEAKKVRNDWRRRIKRAWPEAVVFLYMGRGKSTHRIHFHMVSHGIPEQWLKDAWKYGGVKRIVKLRKHCWYDNKDMGQDYSGLANYLFNHWTPEQGGHRYMCTRNAAEPEDEAATVVRVRREYSELHPPRAPKGYRLTKAERNEYGFLYFRYAAEDEKERGGAA